MDALETRTVGYVMDRGEGARAAEGESERDYCALLESKGVARMCRSIRRIVKGTDVTTAANEA